MPLCSAQRAKNIEGSSRIGSAATPQKSVTHGEIATGGGGGGGQRQQETIAPREGGTHHEIVGGGGEGAKATRNHRVQ